MRNNSKERKAWRKRLADANVEYWKFFDSKYADTVGDNVEDAQNAVLEIQLWENGLDYLRLSRQGDRP